MNRCHLWSLLLLLSYAAPVCAQEDEQLPPRVAQLSAASYVTRESAMRDLAAAGPEAILELATAVYSANPEIRWRSAKVLEEIGAGGDERTLSKVTRVLRLLGEQGIPSMLAKSNGLLHRWRETQAARVIARLETLGAQVSTYGEMDAFGFAFVQPDEESDLDQLPAADPKNVELAPRLDVTELQSAVARILEDSAENDRAALAQQIPSPHTGDDQPIDSQELDAQRVIVAMGANGRMIVQPHGGMADPTAGTVARAIVLDSKWQGGDDGIQLLGQVNNVRMLTLQSLQLTPPLLEAIGRMTDLQYLLIERCQYDPADMFAFRKKYEGARDQAAPLTIRITGQGFLGVMGPLDGTDQCIISQVVEESGAAQAGIVVGDRIVSINDQPLSSFQDLITLVACLQPGTEIRLEIERGGEKIQATAKLQPRPPVYE